MELGVKVFVAKTTTITAVQSLRQEHGDMFVFHKQSSTVNTAITKSEQIRESTQQNTQSVATVLA